NLPNIERGETASRIQNIVFQNTGGNTTVAFDRAKVGPAQHQTIITVGNREPLDEALIAAGLEKQDVQALTDSIEADTGKPGNSLDQSALRHLTANLDHAALCPPQPSSSLYHPLVCSICASSIAETARPFIAPVRSSLTSSNTLGSL